MKAIKRAYRSMTGENSNLTNVRYDEATDVFQVCINGNWVDAIKAYAQSFNWFPDICTNTMNVLGEVIFKANSKGSNNSSTYKANKYIYLTSSSTANGESGFNSGNKIPRGLYKSVTIKYKQTSVSSYALHFAMVEAQTYRGSTINLGAVANVVNSSITEVTYDLSAYNAHNVDLYFHGWMLGTGYIYDITFNK